MREGVSEGALIGVRWMSDPSSLLSLATRTVLYNIIQKNSKVSEQW